MLFFANNKPCAVTNHEPTRDIVAKVFMPDGDPFYLCETHFVAMLQGVRYGGEAQAHVRANFARARATETRFNQFEDAHNG